MFEMPTGATGVVVHRRLSDDEPSRDAAVSPDGRWQATMTGAGFAFLTPRHVLTAAHCVGNEPPEHLWVFLTADAAHEVRRVRRHGQADLAVLELAEDADVQPLGLRAQPVEPGEEFRATGFTKDPMASGSEPEFAGRVIAGHHQRIIRNHRSFMGFDYVASELSVPPPAGLSGAALFNPQNPDDAVAVAAEDFQTATVAESFEEELHDGVTRRVESRRVISYGIAVLLEPLSDWLHATTAT